MCGCSFRFGRQEDAHEYLVALLDAMHEAQLAAHKPKPPRALQETSMIFRIFAGKIRSQVSSPLHICPTPLMHASAFTVPVSIFKVFCCRHSQPDTTASSNLSRSTRIGVVGQPCIIFWSIETCCDAH